MILGNFCPSIGYDIANSFWLSKKEKLILIKAMEEFAISDGKRGFTDLELNLLKRTNSYHAKLYGIIPYEGSMSFIERLKDRIKSII
jgi:hypothetical protein